MTDDITPMGSGQPQMDVTTEHRGTVLILVVTGEVDLLTAPTLIRIIDTALTERPRVLLIDLTEVTFLASIGLAALLRAHHHAHKTTTVTVAADGPVTSRPIIITGLDDVLHLHPTRADALHAHGDL